MKKNPKAINGIAGYTTKLGTAPIACTVTCISKPTSFIGNVFSPYDTISGNVQPYILNSLNGNSMPETTKQVL
jgi:hypothetical protein